MKIDDEIQMRKDHFEAHAQACPRCGHYDGSNRTLNALCLEGTQHYLRLADARWRKLKTRARGEE